MTELALAQNELKKLNLYGGKLDGIWGPATAKGLEQLKVLNKHMQPAWSKKVDDEFIAKVKTIAKSLGAPEEGYEWLMSCMAFESAETFSPSILNFAGSGACVDTATKILTECGWRSHSELSIGDLVWTVNRDTMELELSPVLNKINKWVDELVSIRNQTINSLSSLDHNWPLRNGGEMTSESAVSKGMSDVLSLTECAVTQTHVAINHMAMLAGVVCRWGYVDYEAKTIEITVNQNASVALINKIIQLVIKTIGYTAVETKLGELSSSWIISGKAFYEILQFLMPYPHTPESAHDMLEGILFECDSLEDFTFAHVNSCSKGYILDQILFCSAVAGLQMSVIMTSSQSFTVSKSSNIRSEEVIKKIKTDKTVEVWCPTVHNGTWIARKASSVFLTSNCGLIQFMPSTAKGLGTTVDQLSKMSAVKQLDYVHEYFKPYRNRLKNIGDFYMAILWPRGVGKDDNFVLWSKGDRPTTYRQNIGLDVNKDGVITRKECLSKIYAKLIFGHLAKNRR